MPTFPHFHWDNYFWTTTVSIPAWQGYQSRHGAYGAKSSDSSSDALVRIVFAPEGRDERPLQPNEIALVQWVLDHCDAVHASAIKAIYEKYPEWQSDFGFDNDAAEDIMPDLQSSDDLKRLIGVTSINVHQIFAGGLPYFGIELGCTWDDEHGIGVLMHGTRVVEVGGADTAILLWMARRDAERISQP